MVRHSPKNPCKQGKSHHHYVYCCRNCGQCLTRRKNCHLPFWASWKASTPVSTSEEWRFFRLVKLLLLSTLKSAVSMFQNDFCDVIVVLHHRCTVCQSCVELLRNDTDFAWTCNNQAMKTDCGIMKVGHSHRSTADKLLITGNITQHKLGFPGPTTLFLLW